MSDEKKPATGDALDFDLDAALDEWEMDFDGGDAVRSEAAPLPQTGVVPPPAPPPPAVPSAPSPRRPLYRPPDPGDFPLKPPAAKPGAEIASPEDFSIDFEDDQDATRIGEIPADLIASLRDELGSSSSPTRPPPSDEAPVATAPASPPAAASPAASDDDLELDDLFDGWDESENATRHITPIPSMPSRPPSALGSATATPAASPAPTPAGTPAAPASVAKIREPAAEDSPRLLDDDDFAEFDDLFASVGLTNDAGAAEDGDGARGDAVTGPPPALNAAGTGDEEPEGDDAPRVMPPTPGLPREARRSFAGLRPRTSAEPAPATAHETSELGAETSAAGDAGSDFTKSSTMVPPPASAEQTQHGDDAPLDSARTPAAAQAADDDLDALLEVGGAAHDDDDALLEVGGAAHDDDDAMIEVGGAADDDDDDAMIEVGGAADDDDDDAMIEVGGAADDDDDDAMIEVGGAADDDDDDAMIEVGGAADDDDDDAMIEVGGAADDDDDDAMIEVGGAADDDDDDDAMIEVGGAADDDDDDDAMIEVGGDEGRPDRGASAAARTVRYRKARPEHFLLVGDDPAALRARRDLLIKLADGRKEAAVANLWIAAAELAAREGDADAALGLYRDAHAADPQNPVALRAVRTAAMSEGDYGLAADLLAAEAQLAHDKPNKALALTLLSEISLTQLSDPESALTHARRAAMAAPESLVARLLAAEAAMALDRRPEAMVELSKLAQSWQNAEVRATLFSVIGRDTERRLGPARASESYAAAMESAERPNLDIALGLHRCARASQDQESLARALPPLANAAQSAPLAEALIRAAALSAYRLAGDADRALTLLEGCQSPTALRTRSDIASDADDQDILAESLTAWAEVAGGTERAEALLRLAELKMDAADYAAAEQALTAAGLADETMGLLPVVRDLLARRTHDVSRLVDDGGEHGSAKGQLAGAATLARDLEASAQERTLLQQAAMNGEAPKACTAISLDAAAAAADLDAVDQLLRDGVESAPVESRLSGQLARVDLALSRGQTDEAREMLRDAAERAPGDARLLRPLARLAPAEEPLREASLWLEEAATTGGERSAYCAIRAARIVAASGGDMTGQLRRALDADPTYLPALWMLLRRSLEQGDSSEAARLHEELAELSLDEREAAVYRTRAALIHMKSDPARAASLIERARDGHEPDGLLDELALRIADPEDASARANILEAQLAHAPASELRLGRLLTAAAREQAGDHARSAELYRAVLEDDPSDPIAGAGRERTELAAGEAARVAGRLFDAVRAAEADDERVQALALMADHDLYERRDPASAVLSLQSILELAPGHLPSLRSLERHFMEQARDEDLLHIEELLASNVDAERVEGEDSSVPSADAAAHTRMAARLRLAAPDAEPNHADAWLEKAGDAALGDGWLRRAKLALAHVNGAHADSAHVLGVMATHASTALGRAALRLRAAEAQARATGPTDAAAMLMDEEDAAAHPSLLEARAGYRAAADDAEGAAADLLTAADRAIDDKHRTSVLYRAGVLLEDALGRPAEALAAYRRATAFDIGYRDLFDRSRRLLQSTGDTEGLSTLLDRRLAHGGETPVLVELYLARAALAEDLGDGEREREALQSALALAPDHADALKRLGELCLEAQEWNRAAEALIRLARLRQDREELRFIFFTLGDIYDVHIPDAKRSRAAFERVLKLSPDDLETMERLADIHRRDGDMPRAVEVLTRLIKREIDPDESRRHRLLLSGIFEEMGDVRRAEGVLEQTRRDAPTELTVLVAQADFYQRQGAASALSMHLNRAIDDFRRAIGEDPSDPHAWPGLTHMLNTRGRSDAARCVASAATALGITNVEMSQLVDARGAIPGGGQVATSPELDDVLSPPRLSGALRQVFRQAGPAFEKALPFDARSLGASKASGRDPLRGELTQVAALFGLSDAQLMVSQRLPTVCMAVSGSPATVLVGHELAQRTTPEGRVFLFARSLKVATDHLTLAVRTSPDDLSLLLGGLLRGYDPNYEPAGLGTDIDPKRLDDMAKRVHKAIGRRGRDDLMPLAIEMSGTQGYDPTRVGQAAAELGDRVALVATGDTPGAFRALLSVAGQHLNDTDGIQARIAALQKSKEAFALLSFAISDAYFEARHRIGADRR